RQQLKDQGERIQRQRPPLRQERHAAVIQRIPQGQFSTPEARVGITGRRIRQGRVVAVEKTPAAQEDVREGGQDQKEKEQREATGRPPVRVARARARRGPGRVRCHGRQSVGNRLKTQVKTEV